MKHCLNRDFNKINMINMIKTRRYGAGAARPSFNSLIRKLS